jgi:tRNA (cytosine40_48-C5)-methyltransferase
MELPAFLETELRNAYESSDVERILNGFEQKRPTTFRANTLKASRADVKTQLEREGFSFHRVPWYEDAFVLEEGAYAISETNNTNDSTENAGSSIPLPKLWESQLIKDGLIYVQSLSSMLPPLYLRLTPYLEVLDMCAAPGGKTTQIAALTSGGVHIAACEQNAIRADKLAFNLQKQGAENVTVMRQDARRLDEFFSFDRVLLDAPCSGSGTLNANDPKLNKRFSEALVKDSCKKQAALLAKALEIIKPGGVVLYSTCSVLKRENEDIVRSALARANVKGKRYTIDSIDTSALEKQGVPILPSAIEGAITVCPTALYEGFFMCRIMRQA